MVLGFEDFKCMLYVVVIWWKRDNSWVKFEFNVKLFMIIVDLYCLISCKVGKFIWFLFFCLIYIWLNFNNGFELVWIIVM